MAILKNSGREAKPLNVFLLCKTETKQKHKTNPNLAYAIHAGLIFSL